MIGFEIHRHVIITVSIDAPVAGCGGFQMDEDEYADFERRVARDRDGTLAGLFGLSPDEYLEWLAVDGDALCNRLTKQRKPCRGIVCHHAEPAVWRSRHRQEPCAAHRER